MNNRIITALGVTTVLAVLIPACGTGEIVGDPDGSADEALIQISSEGGFVPVEFNLGRGPTFTVTRGGAFIFPGPQTLEFPGALVTPILEGDLSTDQYDKVISLVEEMGIENIEDEYDNSVTNVADATTEVIKYWDDEGVHRYAVYALGLTDQTPSESTAAFAELFDYLNELASSIEGEPYQPAEVRVVAGAYYGGFDPEFEDIRPWPLEGENPNEWDVFSTIGDGQVWTCKVFGVSVLDLFADATQTTTWTHPSESAAAQNFHLLVRPVHPGENACEL